MAQLLLTFPSEHQWLRFAYGRLDRVFPHPPKQPAYKRPDTDIVDELKDAASRAIVIDKKGYTLFNEQAAPAPMACSVTGGDWW